MAKKKTASAAPTPSLTSWSVDRASLAAALKLAATVVRGSGKIPYLEHVLLKSDASRLTLSATNGTETVTATVDADVPGERSWCLPFKLFSKIVSAESFERLALGDVAGQPHSASVRGRDGSYRVAGLDPQNYPGIPSASEVAEWGSLPLLEVTEALLRCRHAVGTGKRDLSAALLRAEGDDLLVYATDSLRLYRERIADAGATLPGGDAELSVGVSAFDSLAAMDGAYVRVGWSEGRRHLLCVSEDERTVLAFVRSEVRHPDYERVIKAIVRDDFTYTVGLEALESAVERALLTSDKEDVRVVHGAAGLTVSTEGAQGTTEILIPDDSDGGDGGAEWRMRLQGAYLLEAARSMGTEEVRLLVAGGEERLSVTVEPVANAVEGAVDGRRLGRTEIVMRQQWETER